MYIADTENSHVRKITVSTGIITSVAGSGTTGDNGNDNVQATSSTLKYPYSIAVDSSGRHSACIRQSDSYSFPPPIGNVYIADTSNNRVRKVTVSTGIITKFVASTAVTGFSGDGGAATSASLNNPTGIALDSLGTILSL